MIKNFYLFVFVSLFFLGCEGRNAQRIFNSAVRSWDNQRYEEALQNFIAVARTYPKHYLADDALYWIATTYQFYLKRPRQAIVYYKSLIHQFPKSEFLINSNFYIAKIYEKGDSSKIENAIYIYQDLLNTNEITPEQVLKSYQAIVNNYMKIAQYQNARTVLKKMYQKYSNKEEIVSNIYILIASSYEKESKFKFAEITYKEALGKVRTKELQHKIYFKMANLLEANGNFKRAIKIYKNLLSNTSAELKTEYNFKILALQKRLKSIR